MFKQAKTTFVLVLSLIGAGTIALQASAETTEEKIVYEVGLIPNMKDQYEEMVEGFDIFDVEGWKDMELDRNTLEILIFNVAPILGGCNCEIVMNPYTVDTPHARSIEQVKSGKEISHPITVFSGDSRVEDGVYLSESILDPKDFFVGLYTHEDRKEILSLTDLETIKKLNFSVGQDWEIDNKVLDHYGLKKTQADHWGSVIFMLKSSRADVIMQPFFSTPDLSFSEVIVEGQPDEKFLPIPNVKMAFPQGRVYFVSENHPQGAIFLEALNRGITELKSRDNLLRRAHEWAGVINPATADFRLLFDEES